LEELQAPRLRQDRRVQRSHRPLAELLLEPLLRAQAQHRPAVCSS
jgi:hypothetical protein